MNLLFLNNHISIVVIFQYPRDSAHKIKTRTREREVPKMLLWWSRKNWFGQKRLNDKARDPTNEHTKTDKSANLVTAVNADKSIQGKVCHQQELLLNKSNNVMAIHQYHNSTEMFRFWNTTKCSKQQKNHKKSGSNTRKLEKHEQRKITISQRVLFLRDPADIR